MTNGESALNVVRHFNRQLGAKLAAKLGRGRLMEIAGDIADYQEQLEWQNTPSEVRRLQDRIRGIPGKFSIALEKIHLSKKSAEHTDAAMWRVLQKVFPSLDIQPNTRFFSRPNMVARPIAKNKPQKF